MLVELTFSGKRGLQAGEALVAEFTRGLQQLRSWSEDDNITIPFDESCGVVICIDTSVIRLALDTGRNSLSWQIVAKPRRERIGHIESRCEELEAELNELNDLRRSLELEQAREDHPCSCVAYNADLLIYDLIEQNKQGRVGIGFGPVINTLSALRDCPHCHGTGIPS